VIELFFILLIAGTMLIGAEIFVPGGVLGFLGGIFLFGASVTAFIHPDITNAVAAGITGGIIIMVGVVIALWIKFFPDTWIGKQMTISKDLHDAKGTDDHLKELLSTEGVAISSLHPGGYAEINGQRIDVITQGEMIDCNKAIKVIEIEGNRVVVAEIEN